MQSRRAHLASTLALAVAAALSLGFAPAVESGTQSEPESSSAGKCLEGYAYVEVLGDKHGITSTWCIRPTECQSSAGVPPGATGTASAKVHYYLRVPVPSGTDVTCYA